MKHFRILFLLLLAFACKEKEATLAEDTFRIKGTVSGMESGNLYAMSSDNEKVVTDTIVVEQGEFTYEGAIEGPVKRLLISTQSEIRTPDDPFTTLYLEPGSMQLDVNVQKINESKLSGSKTMDEYYKLETEREGIKEKYKQENAAYAAHRESYGRATTEAEQKAYDLKRDELGKALQPYNEEMQAATRNFTANHPESYITLLNLSQNMRGYTLEEAQGIFDKLPEGLKNSREGKGALEGIENKSKGIPGAIVPDFNTVDINGKPVKMDDFKGKYLLIDFWASWCVPCRKGNPHLLDLYAKYNDKGFEILGISDDDTNIPAWHKAVKDDGIGVWRHVLRGLIVDRSGGGFKIIDSGISAGYNISSLPTKILVDPEGVIIGRYGDGGGSDEDMDKKLAEIFGK